ncbi:type I-E CRISPR-associated protein Cse2/CasB [Micromonospora endophytica]|uniref:Type I-E CRISPR-associated protein Cse2/CasB n=1 Tax=Micromonospora endophytica TaxID=515350 RepID=A0A2W2CUQ4_9ACTN|nr:type I-E CRISPR-associated protein Cse2/CasB [Micromonospora endophytica]RIW40975.1 type I-E CRISPR-associated protein Cse2/CasB [Micromonospora endophytica]
MPADQDTPTPTRNRSARRRGSFGGYVATKVAVLQDGYLREESFAIAALARLRAGLGREPGEDFAILAQTQVNKDHLEHWLGGEPTHTERAMHTALTLYAVHQQSIRDRAMHEDGRGLGAAVNLLTSKAASAEAVRRRFAALGTATSYSPVTTHLRSLIRLLRDHRIPLDYGVLAEDLVKLQKPWGPSEVRGLWGRDFYRQPEPGERPEGNATDPNIESAPADATSEE